MNIAIYSRKSKFTGKGDSVENQIELCREYIKKHYTDANIIIYEDEGFSAATTDRPQFKKLLSDAGQKKLDALVCYRLDRVSRSIADFSNIIEDFVGLGIDFVSIKEQFDTSSPMGRAMMYIASVFAQLERETIAERIRDNMFELAKTGRWLGGTTPTGYKSESYSKITLDGKTRKIFKLAKIPEEQNIIRTIYDKYLELKSQTRLETYLLQNNIKTKNGKYFTRFTLRTILENPVYAIADKNMFDYYFKNNIEIYADAKDFDGKSGVISYNKTKQTKNKANEKRDISEWVISVGKHEGIVSGNKWIEVQNLLKNNADKSYRKPLSNISLLTGLMRCGECGSIMRPKIRHKGSDRFSYICDMKMKSNGAKCGQKNINGIEADKMVVCAMRSLLENENGIGVRLLELANNFSRDNTDVDNIKLLKTVCAKNKNDIEALLEKIKYVDKSVVDDLVKEINRLKEANKKIEEEMQELSKTSEKFISQEGTSELVQSVMENFFDAFDAMELCGKRRVLRRLIDKIYVKGEEIEACFYNDVSVMRV